MVYQDFIDRSLELLQRFSPDVPQFTKTSPRNSPEVGSPLIEVNNAPTLKLPVLKNKSPYTGRLRNDCCEAAAGGLCPVGVRVDLHVYACAHNY